MSTFRLCDIKRIAGKRSALVTISEPQDVAYKQQELVSVARSMAATTAMHEIDRRVRQALKRARLSTGLERQEMAERCSLSEVEIARYERGGSRPPAKILLALSVALGTSINEIFRAAA